MCKPKSTWFRSVWGLAALLFVVASARAEDWPRFRGPRGDGISKETGLAESWPAEGPKKVWSAKVGLGYSSVAAAGGRIYLFSLVGNKETLTAYEADSGKVIWSEGYDLVFPSGQAKLTGNYPGTRTTPSIENGVIYTYGAGGELVARELATGKPLWEVNVLKETGSTVIQWGQASSPMLSEKLVYVQGGIDGPVAFAVDKQTGKIAWRSEAGGTKEDIGSYAMPVLATFNGQQQLIIFGGRALYGIDPQTGKTFWRDAWVTGYDINACIPIVDGNRLLVSSDYHHGAMLYDMASGKPKRLIEEGGTQGKLLQSRFQGMILDSGVIYAVADDQGTLRCVSWPDLQQKWQGKGRSEKYGFGGSIVRVGDKLIALSEKGTLALLKATPEGYQKIASFELFSDYDKNWSTPTVYHGKLYVKGQNELVCLDISAK